MSSALAASVIDFLHAAPRFEPRDELRLYLDGRPLGWIRPAVAAALLELAGADAVQEAQALRLRLGEDLQTRSQRLQAMAAALRDRGLLRNWRDEDMALMQDDKPWLVMERAAFRTFGLRTPSVHMNGWVALPEGVALWVARRSPHKFVDPGRLDNLVGGGLSAGESLATGLAREAWEEAGLRFRRVPRPVSTLLVHRRIEEGVQDEMIAVHDCWLPRHWQPCNQDGEVADVTLMPLPEALPLLLAGRFTWDAGLVVIDGLLRQRHFGAAGADIEATLGALGHRP